MIKQYKILRKPVEKCNRLNKMEEEIINNILNKLINLYKILLTELQRNGIVTLMNL